MRVVVEAPQEVAVHDVEPRAADLVDGVAVRERVREAHHRGAGRLERPPIAQAVDGVEPLVRVADERERQDLVPRSTSGRSQEDWAPPGSPRSRRPEALRIPPAPRRCRCGKTGHVKPRENQMSDVRAASIRRQVDLGPAERSQREPWRQLTDRRALGSGVHGRGLAFYVPGLLEGFAHGRMQEPYKDLSY